MPSPRPGRSHAPHVAAALDLRCRFGDILAPTTLIDSGHVRCSAPPLRDYPLTGRARNALQPGEISFDFSRVPNASALAGSATIADGVLVLTQAERFQVGTFFVRPHMHLSAIGALPAFKLGTSAPAPCCSHDVPLHRAAFMMRRSCDSIPDACSPL